MVDTNIKVGPDKDAINAARDAILKILECGKDGQVLIVALETFAKICEVKNTTILGNTFGK